MDHNNQDLNPAVANLFLPLFFSHSWDSCVLDSFSVSLPLLQKMASNSQNLAFKSPDLVHTEETQKKRESFL